MSRILLCVFAVIFSMTAQAAELRVAVTTSFHNSGLSEILLPLIEKDIGIKTRLIVVGTGQALKLGRAGDVDAILVHSKNAEQKFVTDGFATHRREIMFNDFILVGPKQDPARIQTAATIEQAMTKIAETRSLFVSRGDDSGTHRKERKLWQKAGITERSSAWYREGGSGMGATLNTTAAMNAYTLSDRASWLKFANKRDLALLFSGDPHLFNQYAFLPVNPAKHPHVRARSAAKLEAWLASDAGQNAIGAYRLNGEQLFVPNAK